MPTTILSKLQQVNDEQFSNSPSFYIADAKDIQYTVIDLNGKLIQGKPGDGNDLFTTIENLKRNISNIPKFQIKIVDNLPTPNDVNPTAIYLVKTTSKDSNNLYTEYLWNSDKNSFEIIGIQKSDIDGIVEVNTDQTITGLKTFSNGIITNKITTEDNNPLIPGNNVDLGSSTNKWKDIYFSNNIVNNDNIFTFPTKGGKLALDDDLSTVAKSGKYSDLLEIPENFKPSAHTHGFNDINNLILHNSLVKTEADGNITLGVNLGYTTNNKKYGVLQDDTGKLYVDVPWTDTVYNHVSVTNYPIGLYKFQTNTEGHVINAEIITKKDITDLGIPAQDTTYTNGDGLSLVNNTFSLKEASETTIGGIKIGSGLNFANGVASVDFSEYYTKTEADQKFDPINSAATVKTELINNAAKYVNLNVVEEKFKNLDLSLSEISSSINTVSGKVTKYLDGSDETLDQVSEIINYIKDNREDINRLDGLKSAMFVSEDGNSDQLVGLPIGAMVVITETDGHFIMSHEEEFTLVTSTLSEDDIQAIIDGNYQSDSINTIADHEHFIANTINDDEINTLTND